MPDDLEKRLIELENNFYNMQYRTQETIRQLEDANFRLSREIDTLKYLLDNRYVKYEDMPTMVITT